LSNQVGLFVFLLSCHRPLSTCHPDRSDRGPFLRAVFARPVAQWRDLSSSLLSSLFSLLVYNRSATPAMVYHIYIMASASGVLYTGVTSYLETRVTQHKQKLFAGFSAKYNTTKLVYFEPFSDIRNAIAREKQLKRWRREKKVFLIERANPTWRDLSADFFR
jgi:putative endonuclease